MIRKARLDRKMKEKELAFLLKVDPATIQNWEIHGIIPSTRYLSKLEQVLNIKFPASLLTNLYLKNPTTLGEKIKQKRLKLRLTQKEFAKKLGVNVDTIADWEAGRHKPYKRSLSKIREFIQI
ncbi:helix-turn-helix domain-containing protein [bacterium]|nr:helix-turn-helix domain-containing protein [bacterium]